MQPGPIKQANQELSKMKALIEQGCAGIDRDIKILQQLCCKYPLQYVRIFDALRKAEYEITDYWVNTCYVAAVHLTDEAWWKLQRFLVYPPQGEKEEKEFRRSVVFLWPLLEKQNKEN